MLPSCCVGAVAGALVRIDVLKACAGVEEKPANLPGSDRYGAMFVAVAVFEDVEVAIVI